MADSCTATTKTTGKLCRWPTRFPDGFCHIHSPSPEAVAMRAEIQRKAHAASHARGLPPTPPAPETLADAVKFSAWALLEHAKGRMTTEQLKATEKMLAQFSQLVKARDRDAQITALLKLKGQVKA